MTWEFKDGFFQRMCMASSIFNWKLVEVESRINYQNFWGVAKCRVLSTLQALHAACKWQHLGVFALPRSTARKLYNQVHRQKIIISKQKKKKNRPILKGIGIEHVAGKTPALPTLCALQWYRRAHEASWVRIPVQAWMLFQA